MINRFILNEVSYFGPGAREVLPKEIARLGLHKALVVTDKDLIKFGVADKVLKVLETASVPYEVFSDVKPNPTVANVKAGLQAFAASGADFILAIGGGSSIDTSKAIGIITNNPEFSDVVSLEGVADTKNKSVPIIALPTTAGTAAEVTINYVITDEANEKKMVCVDPNDIPVVAVVDAELMYTLPKGLTASTGLDALTHAIEGLITKGAWEMSDMFEIKAIEMIARYLETAVNEPSNAEARNGMAVAQYIAGMAFSNVGLGVVHGMAHPLGAIFDIPHGVANALLLPIVMEFNAPAALDKYVEIAKAMNVYTPDMTREEAAAAAVKAVRELSVRVGIPQHLSELGIKEEDLDKLIRILTVCFSEDPLYHALIPDRDTRERLMPELFTCDLTEFFETCEIYADSSELNSILVVSDGTEHEAALHNLMVDFFALLKTDGYLIKEDTSLATLRKFIQGKDYLNSSWTSQLHTAERLHVIYLAVAPKMQHHGLAEKLMDEVIDYADRHKLMISLETHNPANVSMYEKFGFKLYGIVQKKGFDLKQYCMIKQA